MLHTRCDAALRSAREDFERTLTVLREENSTLRRMLEAANARADEQATALVKSLATAPAALAPPSPIVPPHLRPPTSKDPIAGLGNVLDPVDFGHPEGIFDSTAAASLMLADEDQHGAAAAA